MKKKSIPQILLLLIISLILIIINLQFILAIDVPLGVDGHVYDVESLIPAPSWTQITITNKQTNETIQDTIGRGDPGRYSFVLNWEPGVNITIRANNPSYAVEKNMTLSGIIHDVDLLINTSVLPVAPTIISTALLKATQHKPYEYNIIAFDWNNDPLTFSLKEYPAGMYFIPNTSTIIWTPTGGQAGDWQVIVNVSDGTFTTQQSFTINVQNNNIPPEITTTQYSIPSNVSVFVQQLIAIDPEGDNVLFTLVEGPENCSLSETGLLIYNISGKRPHNETLVIRTSDDTDETLNSVYLLLESIPQSGGSVGGSSGGRGGGGFFDPSLFNKINNSNSTKKDGVLTTTSTILPTPPLPAGNLKNDSIIHIPFTSTIVIHATNPDGTPFVGKIILVIENIDKTFSQNVTIGNGTINSSFSIVLYDMKNSKIIVKPFSPYYHGTELFVAGQLNNIRLNIKKNNDPVSIVGLFIEEKFDIIIPPFLLGIMLLILLLCCAALVLKIRIKKRKQHHKYREN